MTAKKRLLTSSGLVASFLLLALAVVPAPQASALTTYSNYITFTDSNGDLTCTSATKASIRHGSISGRQDFYSNTYLGTQSSDTQSNYEHLRVLSNGGFTGVSQCLQGSFNGLTFHYSDFYTEQNGFINGETLIASGDYILTIYTTNDIFANSNVNFLNFIKGKNLYNSDVISDIQNNFTYTYRLDSYAQTTNPNIYFGLYNYYSLNGGSNMVMEFKLSVENDISYGALDEIYYFNVGTTDTDLSLNEVDNNYYMSSSIIPDSGIYYTLSLDAEMYEFGELDDVAPSAPSDSPSADFNAEQNAINQNGSNAQNTAGSLSFGGFNVPNPFLNWFALFTDNACVSIPTIASWLHANETNVCSPWRNTGVREVATPIMGVLGGTILFGFLVRWLKGKEFDDSIEVS